MEPSNYENDRKLRLKTLAGAIPSKPCPNCNAMLKPEDMLCVKCGFNLQIGKVASAHKPRNRRPLPIGRILYSLFVLGVIGAFIFGGLYAFLTFIALDSDAPKLRAGGPVRVTLASGGEVRGVLEQVTRDALVIVSIPNRTNTVAFTNLVPAVRVRCDSGFKTGYMVGETRAILTFAHGDPVSGFMKFRSELADETRKSKPPFPVDLAMLKAWIEEQTAVERKELSAAAKPFTIGQEIEIRRATGQIVQGTVVELTNSAVSVTGLAGIQQVPFQELDNVQRMQLDSDYCDDIAHLRAVRTVRKAVATEGSSIPDQSFADEVSLNAAVETGHPAALAAVAKAAFEKRCYSEAAIFADTAAALEDPAALYLLGHMYVNGFGVARDMARAMSLMQDASVRNNIDAQLFLVGIESLKKICPTCNGVKKIKCSTCGGFGFLSGPPRTPCGRCRGEGVVSCEPCHGTGQNPKK